MPFAPLVGGAYQNRAIISACQRCLNLYPEPQDQQKTGEPWAVTHFCTPGLTLQATNPNATCRCLYTASNGDLWTCYGQQIWWIDSSMVWHHVGDMLHTQPKWALPVLTPVSMVDNGTTIFIADGTGDGWYANVLTHDGFTRYDISIEQFSGWLGATKLAYQDGFVIGNEPGTPVFTVSGNFANSWNALDFASISGTSNNLVAPVSCHRTLLLLGTLSFEWWINNGGDGTALGSFPFSIYPEAWGDWGCVAPYSIAQCTNQAFFVSRDKYGKGVVMRAENLSARRISTFAIEYQISTYPRIDDAVAFCYQQLGHWFYCLTFPSGGENYRGATWVYDDLTEEWHERCMIDDNGLEYRIIPNQGASAYGNVYVGDWRSGALYTYDPNNYTDAGAPIKRLRSWPHALDTDGNRRLRFTQVIANMQVGSASEVGTTIEAIDATFVAPDGTLLEDYSNINDRGATFTEITGEAVIVNDLVSGLNAGAALYEASGTPAFADYYVRFNAVPDNYVFPPADGASLYAIGRANASNNGYLAGIFSDGTEYSAKLEVMGGSTSTVVLGTLTSGYYQVTLTMMANTITVAVLRSQDGKWADLNGNWVGSPTVCINVVDDTYTLAGRVLIGGNWE